MEDGWMCKMCDFNPRDQVVKSGRVGSVTRPSTHLIVYVCVYADLNV